MKSSLKERLARLGSIQDVSRVVCGSPLVLSLSPSRAATQVLTVPATLALAKRGLTLLKAKRVIEEMLDRGRAVAQIPTVEDETALARELEEAGCSASRMGRPEIDVRALRERLGLTQDQFALRYALDVDTLRNWESRRRHPDAAALAYLGVIASLPEQVSMVLEQPLAPTRASMAEAVRLRVMAVGVMEALHPGRSRENRRMVGRVPDETLADVLKAAEDVVTARIESAAKPEPEAPSRIPA